jgi:hypothetical protein
MISVVKCLPDFAYRTSGIYRTRPSYRQHSSLGADGPDALRELVAHLHPDLRYERARVIIDVDLVAHGTYPASPPNRWSRSTSSTSPMASLPSNGTLCNRWR